MRQIAFNELQEELWEQPSWDWYQYLPQAPMTEGCFLCNRGMKEEPMDPRQTFPCFSMIHVETGGCCQGQDAVRALAWAICLWLLCLSFPCSLFWASSSEAAALPPSNLLCCWCSHATGGHGQDSQWVKQKGPSWICWCTAGSPALTGVNIRAQLITAVDIRQQETPRWQHWTLHLTAEAGKMFQVSVTNSEHLYQTHF